jgi:RHS repeat-associated protein
MTKKTGPESPLRLEFGYDERSRRITKRVLTGSNYQTLIETRRFIWDGWLMVGEVIEKGSSTETKTYLWGWDVSGSEEGAGGVGGLIGVQNTSGVYFPIYDGNGNTRHLWGLTEGTVVDSADYGPFGELTQSPTTDHSPFWFSSKYWDQESGLLYYGYRFYSPELGRWTNRDPIEEDGGENLYGFAGNTPTDNIDRTGLDFIAVGSSPAGFDSSPVRHMSLNYFTETQKCVRERDRVQGNGGSGGISRGGRSRDIPNNASLTKTIDLQPNNQYRTVSGRRNQSHQVLISEIIFDNVNNAEYYVVIYADSHSNSDASGKWDQIHNAAQAYAFAQFPPQSPRALNWPNSKYGIGINGNFNNSNTFIREMARVIGRNADWITGNHPGNSSPQQVHDRRPRPTLSL